MAKLKVLIVDDSAVFRRTISNALEQDSAIEIVGTAANGEIALEMVRIKHPDIVILDVEMPKMDGIETLRRIHQQWPTIRVIMFSAHTQSGASSTLEALSLGAVDFVTKPTGATLEANQLAIQQDLVPKICAFSSQIPPQVAPKPKLTPAPIGAPLPGRSRRSLGPPLVAIGISTGGPNALVNVLSAIKKGFPSPIVITQHMPPMFTEQLANRLDKICPLHVCEAKEGQPVESGNVYIAPGDFHMEVQKKPANPIPVVHLHQGPKECSCRPSVDVMFRSIATSHGTNVIGVVMTGMGQDGFEGGKVLKACDAYMIAQDRETCVVYGMPSFIVNYGLADEVLPLDQIGPRLMDLAGSW
jgi:two-component system, chemotaxis family, protein-glutamate methylesterase/glutaminase